MPAPPLILLPGLAATREVFAPQLAAFPDLVVPEWIEPARDESLAGYAQRLAAVVDPGVPCVVGGLSFGGMVATELCKHLDARALVLIATLAHPRERPRRARWGCAVLGRTPDWLVWCAQRVAWLLAPLAWCVTTRSAWTLYRQAWAQPARIITWSARAIAGWEASDVPIACPVLRIHGAWDPVLPARAAVAAGAEIVPRGLHVLTLWHPRRVNALLERARGAERESR